MTKREFLKLSLAGATGCAVTDAASVGDDPHLSWTDYFATNSDTTDGSGARAYHVQVASDPLPVRV